MAEPLDPSSVLEPTGSVALDLPFDVVVWDDPVTLMTVVTRILMAVFGYPQAKAHRLMLTVHHEGRAVVWSGSPERAEQYCVQLHARGLQATVEPSR